MFRCPISCNTFVVAILRFQISSVSLNLYWHCWLYRLISFWNAMNFVCCRGTFNLYYSVLSHSETHCTLKLSSSSQTFPSLWMCHSPTEAAWRRSWEGSSSSTPLPFQTHWSTFSNHSIPKSIENPALLPKYFQYFRTNSPVFLQHLPSIALS